MINVPVRTEGRNNRYRRANINDNTESNATLNGCSTVSIMLTDPLPYHSMKNPKYAPRKP